MTGAFNTPHRRRQPSINVTPLIDVMFLLLIFFMVSSTFKEDIGIDITLPRAGSASAQSVSSYQITVDRNGGAYFSGEAVNVDELRARLKAVLAEEPDASIVLRADTGADFGPVLRVIDIARELEATNLVIPTDPLEPAASQAGNH